jgi:hypothetical protein
MSLPPKDGWVGYQGVFTADAAALADCTVNHINLQTMLPCFKHLGVHGLGWPAVVTGLGKGMT